MIKLRALIYSLCLLPGLVIAGPQKVEMIFLSPQKISMLLEQLDQFETPTFSKHIAQAEMDNCVPMGDGCFHPQYGFIEKKDVKPVAAPTLEEKKLELKNFNATETSMISCDKNNYFDIFCGKERPNTPPAEIEVWFDISSSLKTVDYNKDPNFCARRSFIEKVTLDCKSKVNVYVYNTAIKEAGENSSVCLAYGTNDQKRLLTWIKDSKAKQLLIVTDIDEVSAEMRDYLGSLGAKMTGDGVKAFTANDLVDYAKEFTKMCK